MKTLNYLRIDGNTEQSEESINRLKQLKESAVRNLSFVMETLSGIKPNFKTSIQDAVQRTGDVFTEKEYAEFYDDLDDQRYKISDTHNISKIQVIDEYLEDYLTRLIYGVLRPALKKELELKNNK